MKSYNHLMEQYLSDENYYAAVRDATVNKGGRKSKIARRKKIRENPDLYKAEFMEFAAHYKSDPHTPILIHDGIKQKQRRIVAPTMREQVAQHMMMRVLQPIFMRGMYEHSYGSIPGRGSHAGRTGRKKNHRRQSRTRGGKEAIEKWIRTDRKGMKYYLKMDIRHYYDSVPRATLKEKLRKLIHDRQFLNVVCAAVDADDSEYGIPIGFYLSQWFANWYLTGLDHYIKEKLGARHYIRYVDDMVIFGSNKKELHRIRQAISDYLQNELGLELKRNWCVSLFDYTKKDGARIGSDLDFMGFRFYRDKTVLRREIMLKITRKVRRIARKQKATIYDCRQMMSFLGWIDCTDTYGMYLRWVKSYVDFHRMKRRVRDAQRRRARRMKAA